MKCYKHNDTDIVVQCHNCGKGLCSSCSNRFEFILCESCLIANNEEVVSSAKKSLKSACRLFVVGFVLSFGTLEISWFFPVFWGYVFAGVPLGWKTIDKKTPNFILIMPIIGWLIFFLYKFVFSAIIGIFRTPFHIKRILNEIKEINSVNKEIAAGKI